MNAATSTPIILTEPQLNGFACVVCGDEHCHQAPAVSVAKWERRVIGERTSAAMQAAKRQGKHMGRVSVLQQSTRDRLLTLRATYTLAATAVQLNAEGLTTATGAPWPIDTVAKVQKRLNATKGAEATLAA